MTDEIQEEVAEEVVTEEVSQEQEEHQEPARDPEAESEARKYGWRPKEEFDRDPEGWVDAERFLQLPSTGKKMLRDELREVKSDFATRMERLERTNKETLRRALEAQQREHEEKLSRVRYERREAASEGDTERYDRLDREEQQLLKAAPKEPEIQEVQREDSAPAIDQYRASEDGKWISDPFLFEQARAAINGGIATKQLTSNDPITQLEFAKGVVRKHFPQAFSQPEPKPKTSKVDGGGLAGGKLSNNKLPAEARRAAEEFVEAGYYKSVDDYAKFYFSENNQ